MTALAEACADLKPLLPILEELITEPDTQARAGHTKPGSRIPGNSGVLAIIGDVHNAARTLEIAIAFTVTGRIRPRRGGSDANTVKALDTVSRLSEALPACPPRERDPATGRVRPCPCETCHHVRQVSGLVTAALCQPAIDLEQPWRKIPGPCPRCGRAMLRYRERDRPLLPEVACLGCMKNGRMMPGTVSDGYIEWQDGTLT